MAVTIKEIAQRCGVSEGTVDRALNNRKGISEATKAKIMEVAKEMGYKPNHLAQCLATGSTKTIGVVCPDIHNHFFSMLIEAIEHEATKQGYFITLILTHNIPQKEIDGIRYLADRQVDGILLFPIALGDAYVEELKKLEIPIVTIYNRLSPVFTHVDVDCRTIMKEGVSRLHAKGYDQIIYMDFRYTESTKSGINLFSITERRLGYLDGVQALGLAEHIFEGCPEEILGTLKPEDKGHTALMCPTDHMAIWVNSLCQDMGIRVPEDVGIIGFDNIDVLRNITPHICSVEVDKRELAKQAFAILLEKIHGEYTGGDVVCDYEFTEGDTI